jgi:hypothetical protein
MAITTADSEMKRLLGNTFNMTENLLSGSDWAGG